MHYLTGLVQFGDWPDRPLNRGIEHHWQQLIHFDAPFDQPPCVSAAISLLDAESDKNIRLDSWISDITQRSFRLHVKCWANSQTWKVQYSWLAVTPSYSHQVQTGISERCGSYPAHPIQNNAPFRKRIQFHHAFQPGSIPTVALGLSMLDLQSNSSAFRIRTSCDNIDSSGFDLVCESWEDSIVWGCKVAWTAMISDSNNQSGTVACLNPISSDYASGVCFDHRFAVQRPVVSTFLRSFEISNRQNLRFKSCSVDINHHGFISVASSWSGSSIVRAEMSWLALKNENCVSAFSPGIHIGSHIALVGVVKQCALQCHRSPNGTLSIACLQENIGTPPRLENTRTWERLQVVDAYNGRVGLFCTEHQALLVMDSDGNVGFQRVESSKHASTAQGAQWNIVNAGNGHFALHNSAACRFLRMTTDGHINGFGGIITTSEFSLAPESSSERFIVLSHPLHIVDGKYEVTNSNPIGTGWFGKTFTAVHQLDGRSCAIKVIQHSFRQNEQLFRKEVQILSVLPQHRNLLQYHNSFVVNDQLYVVTELVRGFNLKRFISQQVQISSRVLLSWAFQIFDGLAALHSAGIIHRDLHLENIMCETESGLPNAHPNPHFENALATDIRIIDVGQAKQRFELQMQQNSYKHGPVRYSSPERLHDNCSNDRDDIWAIGCLLGELSSGIGIDDLPECGAEGRLFAVRHYVQRNVDMLIDRCRHMEIAQLIRLILIVDVAKRPSAMQARELVRRALVDMDQQSQSH